MLTNFIATSSLQSDDVNSKDLAIHHFMQGEFLLNQGNYALAVLEFQDAISIDPNASTIHVSIADAYRRLGRAKRAEDHLKIAIDLDPKDISSRAMLGQLYLLSRNYIEAENQFLVLSHLDQGNDDYLSILGDIAKIQQQWIKSIDFFLDAYRINPQNFKALENAMQVCLTAELFKKAEGVCKLLVQFEPNNNSCLLYTSDAADE